MLNLRCSLFALLLICGSAWSSSPEAPKSPGRFKQTNNPQRGTDQSLVFVKGEVTTHKSEQEAKDDAAESKEKSTIDQLNAKYACLTALFTFCLFATAFVQVVMFWRQLKYMREGINDAKSVAESSLVQANSLISTARAHVFIKRIHYEPVFTHISNIPVIRAWKLYPVCENGGSTPTKHCVMHVSSLRGTDDEVAKMDNGFPDLWIEGEPKELSPFFIGPKAEKWSAPIEVSVVDLEKIKQGTQKFFMWGWIDYNDVLENTSRHRTEFAYGMFVAGDFTSPQCGLMFRELDEFNGADGECYREPQPYQPRPHRA